MSKWVMFTKRTDYPKLGWLKDALDDAGVDWREGGHSFHAPILEVKKEHETKAWEILTPVDDVPDDDPRYSDWAVNHED